MFYMRVEIELACIILIPEIDSTFMRAGQRQAIQLFLHFLMAANKISINRDGN